MPIDATSSGSRRKITVNERVERILHGALQSEEPRTASADARSEIAKRRSRQLAGLYTSSLEDKFVRSRIISGQREFLKSDGAKSVPKNVHLGRRKVTGVPPIEFPADSTHNYAAETLHVQPTETVKCYAKHKLEELQLQEAEERRKALANQFPAPDFSPPKPWYEGYSSVQKTPSCTVDAKIRRYGAYGAIKMLAKETASGTSPHFVLRTSQSLDSLAYKDAPNAWSPSLHGSPSLWPEDACYVTGSSLESTSMLRCPSPSYRFPSHVVGKNEPPLNDGHFVRMQSVHAQDIKALELAFDQEKERRKLEIVYNKEKLQHWKANLHFEHLSSKMDHPFVHVRAKKGRELTILHSAGYSSAVQFDGHVEKLSRERFSLRWKNMSVLLEVMKKTPCRRPVLQDIDKLFALSHEISLKNLNHLELNRQQFWELLSHEYPRLDLLPVNRVFSSYDYKMEDRIDMRLFLATVRAMRVQQGTPIEMITLALQDFDLSKRHVVSKAEHFAAVIAMCSGCEKEEIELLSAAHKIWGEIRQQFAVEIERRHQRRIRGVAVDEDECLERELTTTAGGSHTTIEDDLQSEVESLLFVGRDDEPCAVPIKFVRNVMRLEKNLLKSFTDSLIRRREECNEMVMRALSSKTRVSTPTEKLERIG